MRHSCEIGIHYCWQCDSEIDEAMLKLRVAELEALCERSYKFLGYWFSSLKPEEAKLWQDLHVALKMQPTGVGSGPGES